MGVAACFVCPAVLTNTSLANLNEAGVTLPTLLSSTVPASNTSLFNVTLKPQANR